MRFDESVGVDAIHAQQHVHFAAPNQRAWQRQIDLIQPGEARYRPLTLELLRVVDGQVVEVVDWSRPELFEAFGLPMSFPPSDRYNQDDVNAKEVR